MKYIAKALSPRANKNKTGVTYTARVANYSTGTRVEEELGTYDTFAEAEVVAVERKQELEQFKNNGIVETEMTILEFILNHYLDWRSEQVVANDVKKFIRYIQQIGLSGTPLQKVNRKWCEKFRAEMYLLKPEVKHKKEYQLNTLVTKLNTELNNCLDYAYQMGFVKQNYNIGLSNPLKNHPRWIDTKEQKYLKQHKMKNTVWDAEKFKKYIKLFKQIPNTQIVKATARPDAQSRSAYVVKASGSDAWRVFWVDNNGDTKSKAFNWKKMGGRENAKVLADAYAEEITKTLEQGDGTYVSQRRTFQNLDSIMWWAYANLSLLLGLRNGEICALKFSDFDIQNRMVTINKQLVYRNKQLTEDKPKSSSFRDITFPPELIEVLDKLKLHYETIGINDGDYLLQYRNGGAVRPDYWVKHFKKVQRLAGIPEFDLLEGTHAGRKTHLTLLARGGVPQSIVKKRAGHSKIQTTEDYYIVIDSDAEASDVVHNILKSENDSIIVNN